MALTDTSTAALLSPTIESERGVRWALIRRRLLVWVPAGFVVFLVLTCFLGPVIFPVPPPVGGSVLDSALPPGSPGHPLGTDINGNDVVSRLLHGGQASLIIALSVNAIGIAVGGTFGALAAYLGGRADTVIMRVMDLFIAFPSLVLTIAIAQELGRSLPNTILALCAFSIPGVARVSRSSTMKVMSMPFVQAARLAGSPWWRVLLRHLTPNIAPQLLNFAMLGMGLVIVTEGALSFLGLGIPAPAPSWGNMIFAGQQALSAAPLLVLWPSLALLVTVLAFNVLGENLRDEMSIQ